MSNADRGSTRTSLFPTKTNLTAIIWRSDSLDECRHGGLLQCLQRWSHGLNFYLFRVSWEPPAGSRSRVVDSRPVCKRRYVGIAHGHIRAFSINDGCVPWRWRRGALPAEAPPQTPVLNLFPRKRFLVRRALPSLHHCVMILCFFCFQNGLYVTLQHYPGHAHVQTHGERAALYGVQVANNFGADVKNVTGIKVRKVESVNIRLLSLLQYLFVCVSK